MTTYTTDDFEHMADGEGLDEFLRTGLTVPGVPGTPEHAEAVATALSHASEDIYYDASDAEPVSLATHHANVCMLQSAAQYAVQMMEALARDPDLLERVQAAIEASAAPKP